MTAARKAAIVRKAAPVSEYLTETREGMDNIADAIRTLAGVISSVAAGMHTNTLGNQRNMAAVIFRDAQDRFPDVLRRMDEQTRVELEKYIAGLCKTKR